MNTLESHCSLLKGSLLSTADMRLEVLQLHRKLNQEKTKSTALMQEMSTPQNIHRWRKLGHKDPKEWNFYQRVKDCRSDYSPKQAN